MAANPKQLPVSTEVLVDALYDARSDLGMLQQRRKDALDELITPEIRERMGIIEAEYEEPLADAQARATEAENLVKDRVLREACSAKGQYLHAIWVKGRVSWDSKGLEGFSKAEPKILAFRTEGSPSVTIRGVAQK